VLRGGIGILIWLYLGLGIVGLGGMFWTESLDALVPSEPMMLIHQIVVGLGGGAVLVLVTRMLEKFVPTVEALTHGFAQMLGNFSPRHAGLAALASSLGEEIFFRGFLQSWWGLWLSSLIFALLHIGPDKRFISWPFLAFGASLLLGGLMIYTETIWASVIAHAVVNFVNLNHIQAQGKSAKSFEPV
jgi:membrane protease YdiL (CAAX protease family)